ncbi:nucleotidyltransferase family protein [Allocoleopsis franciscana]|uniref:Putative MobA-like protein n=1 Tax=Allocoleopsis franciscana PCC 7113 TaxID=1173027 RepID=K9W7F6_9CYAN|nr:nucleotidyltransferase family protein [Allocoleopsis franciscana]AFZ16315.1 putative MobA-like protein [Allocoleopsis franciscana PCC 7113]
MNSRTVGLMILAAGASTRMGTPKQLLTYRGCSFVHHIIEVAVASLCQPIAVVLGANVERIKPEISQFPVQIVENQDWEEGMSASIRVGLEALLAVNQNLDAVAIALCDQPFVLSQTLNQLVEAYHLTRKPIIASEYSETFGVPALFSRTMFSELMTLKSNEGAKQLIKRHIHEVYSIPFPGGAIDIDTPNDYEQLQFI